MRLANDLRRFYLMKEIEGSTSKCLTINRLLGINKKFGSATNMKFSLEANPRDLQRRMATVLADPFSPGNKQRRRVSAAVSATYASVK